MANVGSAWDTPLPRGVTPDMLPAGSGAAVATQTVAPRGEALRRPLNLAVKPPAQPLLAKPEVLASAGGGVLYGGAAAAAAWAGGAGFWEGVGAGIGGGIGGGTGGLVGAAAGSAAGTPLGTASLPVVGTVSGAAVGGYIGGAIGTGILGGIGSSLGSGLGRFVDDLVPDFFGGSDEYPNELNPFAMYEGALIDPGIAPPFTGGQSPGVNYRIRYSVGGVPREGVIPTMDVYGPVSGLTRQETPGPGPFGESYGISYPGTVRTSAGTSVQVFLNLGGASFRWINSVNGESAFSVTGLTVTPWYGEPDTGGDPPGGVDAVRAPNPARQATPGAAPRTLPSPAPQPTPSDTSWPETAPQDVPDTTPLASPAPVPNFSPTPTEEPTTTTTPEPAPQPTDLEAPSETPSNLAENPLTPPAEDPLTPVDKTKPTGGRSPILGGLPGTFSGSSTSPLAVAIPVVLLEGLRQKVNTPTADLTNRTQPNPSVQVVKPQPVQTANLPQPPTCIYEQQRVMDIQSKATDTQQRAANPVSGFPGLYGIGIESRLKLGETFDLLGNVNTFMRKAWETTRIQKVINALTLITAIHNAAMLSRFTGQTLLDALSGALDLFGVDDEEGNRLDLNAMLGKSVENLLKNVLGEEVYNDTSKTWQKANRIVQIGSNIVWSVRSIMDTSLELAEYIANNTGKIGNSLKRFGVIGENAFPDMSESARAQNKWRRTIDRYQDGLETIENVADTVEFVTQAPLEIASELGEIQEQRADLRTTISDGEPIDYPQNEPIATVQAENKEESIGAEPTVESSQRSAS
ncbi:hypothetical protein IQ265_00800 [Nodosilinea sp. LEGE 06152]|uniref:hypothetical protein n=1 Tax=Nodosilinea sp. LEGE 06152 TaxID=2777966 RepID=UPI0018803F41|nr:hypothetical protein [Nodosilinea sp. LEGE 06152]MBE9155386.1 hypothetical protein [Nodosilinea sp. LEGE 06152]